MPVFLHSESSELNPLLRAKEHTFSNLRKKYKGEPISDIGQTDEGYKQYETMAGLLTKLTTELVEAANVTSITTTTAKKNDALISLMSAINVTSTTLRRYLEILPNLSQFTPTQYQGIKNFLPDIQSLVESLLRTLPSPILGTFQSINLETLINRLQGYIVDFNYTMDMNNDLSASAPEEASEIPEQKKPLIQVISSTPAKTPKRTPKNKDTIMGLSEGFLTAQSGKTPRKENTASLPTPKKLEPPSPVIVPVLSHRELQKIAKNNDIKANQSTAELTKQLRLRNLI